MKDYTARVSCEETANIVFVSFVSDYPVGSVGFFEDMYDAIDNYVFDYTWKVLEFEEGF